MKTQNIIPASIEMRAIKFISKGVEVIEAVKMAIEEEQILIDKVINNTGLTQLGTKIVNHYAEKMFNKANG